MLGDERQDRAVELVGGFPPDRVPRFREHNKLGAFDAIRDASHQGRRRVQIRISGDHQRGNLDGFQ